MTLAQGSISARRRERLAGMVLAAYAVAVCAFLLAPIVVAFLLSFSSVSQLVFPPPGLSLRWFVVAFETDQFISGFWYSTVIAGCTGVVSAIAGTAAAIAINHYRFRFRSSIQTFIMLPLALPGIVIGLGILYTLSLYGIKAGVVAGIIGHSVLGVPYVTYLVLATLANYDLTLEQASINLGATRTRTFMQITLPLIRPGILAGAVFAFLISFDNVAVSVFLVRGQTLPLRLMQHIQFYADPSVAAVSTFLIVASLVVLLLFGRALRQRDLGTDRT